MDTVIIPLSKRGKCAGKYVAIVDEADKDLADLSWTVNALKNTQYAMRHIRINRKQIAILLHRVILSRMLGRELLSSEQTDHINGDGLDNRRENLRLATSSQNHWNQKRASNNSSGYKGVTWSKHNKKWRAQIMYKKNPIFLGYFDRPELAHEEYCKAAKELFGEFANFD